MKLSQLVGDLPIQGDLGHDPEVFGVRHDSRAVAPGDLFVAWKGLRHDGARFGADALARGAVAVVADSARPPGVEPRAPWLVAAEPRRLLGALAAPLYGHPDRRLTTIGVTGTNGKSTTVELVAAMLDAAGRPCGRIGTLGARFPGLEGAAIERTSPEASDLFRILESMRRLGARAAAMEVSSHALAQGRVDGAAFDVGVFTNLTRDHFDFHAGFDDYFETKARLFQQLKPHGKAVVNLGDAHGARLAERLPGALGYGLTGESAGAAETQVAPRRVALDQHGLKGELATPRGPFAFESPLLGRYNLDNLLAAVAAAEALELPHAAMAAGIAATRPLPGRMEPVDAGQPFVALIDYAHTEAALEAAIRSTRELSGAKVVVVFGCGGDRDPGKRPRMGKVAGTLADLPIVTSDNPRSEDPLAIIAAVEDGLRTSGNAAYRVVPDRREAIRRAVAVASQGGWALLVAGKGHEREQIVGDERLPFSDKEELERALLERIGSGTGAGARR
jgi:UDP-N-acetylmuramoyl-L-alanyl-D-glutamate--2,6-diaminopimelate ligase